MTQEKDMTKEYEALKKKHSLPELAELDKEFCVGKLEETDFVLRVIVSKMSERLEQVAKVLGDVIQPENNLSHVYEAEAFSDDEKKKIFELFKKASYYQTELVINDFEHDEDSAAKLINKTFKEWKSLKQEFLKILEKIKNAWKNQKISKLELGYFG
ncbi:hypothetical protein KY348_03005 [Candidatus Woesearchaeota archaeon]|nr:hypothetical protein [Candidatus Woesearchaeota archaeon]